jgi:hypothetical protein
MVVIVEVKNNSKTYNQIKFSRSKMHLKQRLFEVKDGETITSDELKTAMNKASQNMPDKNIALEICVYYENVGWRAGKVFNAGENASLYCEEYGTTEELGGVMAWEIYYLPKRPTVI